MIGVVVIVFAVQNVDTVTYTFLAWSLTASRALVVVPVFLVGLLTGWLGIALRRLQHSRKKKP